MSDQLEALNKYDGMCDIVISNDMPTIHRDNIHQN